VPCCTGLRGNERQPSAAVAAAGTSSSASSVSQFDQASTAPATLGPAALAAATAMPLRPMKRPRRWLGWVARSKAMQVAITPAAPRPIKARASSSVGSGQGVRADKAASTVAAANSARPAMNTRRCPRVSPQAASGSKATTVASR